MQNRQLIFSPKKPYDLVAESLLRRDKLREANPSYLQFPTWCAGGDLVTDIFLLKNSATRCFGNRSPSFAPAFKSLWIIICARGEI